MIQTQAPSFAVRNLATKITEEKKKAILENYLKDASNYRGNAEKVVLPATEAEVSYLLKEANEKKIAVTVSGGGTGLAGARVPQGGIILSTEKMDHIRSIHYAESAQEGYVVLEPGVVLKDFEEVLDRKGLFYPPDPTGKFAFMGGTIATNASGARSFKYGATRDYVRRLRVVLSNGDILELVRGKNKVDHGSFEISFHGERVVKIPIPDYSMPKVKNVAGYYAGRDMDLIDLFIGSEGTLGVVTEIELKILRKPNSIVGGILFFRSEKECYYFMTHAREVSRSAESGVGLNPRLLEFFDRYSLKLLAQKYAHIPNQARAALFFEQECLPNEIHRILEEWTNRSREFKALSSDSWVSSKIEDQILFRNFRQDLPFFVKAEVQKRGFRKIGTDMAVPDDKAEQMFDFYLEKLNNSGIRFLIFGHFGDNHLHANLLPRTEEEFTHGKVLYDQFVRKAIDLGGTVSAEHGIGKIKVPYLEWMYGRDAIIQMARLKSAFDPHGILSPGNIFPAGILKEIVR